MTKAVVEMRDGTEFAGIWYIELPGCIGNVFASISKQPGEQWRLVYRFRYYVDDKNHHSKDKKNWYVYQGDKDKLVDTFTFLAQKMKLAGASVDFIDATTPEQIHAEVIKRPWAHLEDRGVEA